MKRKGAGRIKLNINSSEDEISFKMGKKRERRGPEP